MTAKKVHSTGRGSRPDSFAEWRARLDREAIAPVIAVAGSRGKTSVLRAVESIFRASELRFAIWTDRGVEIEGVRQRGELGPWSRALTRLAAGGLDVALQEVDWATIRTFGSRPGAFPIVAVANLCGNNEACLVSPETLLARRALARIRTSAATPGRLILNADDFAVAEAESEDAGGRFLVGISPETPVLGRHLLRGGDACWVEDETIVIQEDEQKWPVVDVRQLTWTKAGTIPFAVQNALIATAIARCCGVSLELVASGLASHDARPGTMPGSFNVFAYGSASIVLDRPVPPWFLRTSLRATANLGSGRQVRIAGPMAEITLDDLPEVGRLLGRSGGVLIIHGAWTPDRLMAFRQGAASNEVPPFSSRPRTNLQPSCKGSASSNPAT